MTWQICTWTLSSQQMVLHDYQESHYINFPASFRVQTKHYETKMSNPMYSLKNPTKFSFLLSTCLSDDTANRKCLFLWVHVPQYDILQKWSSFFFSKKYQPCVTNKTALDWENVKEASIFIFRLCCSPFDPESNESCTYKQVLLYGLEFI